MLIGLRFTKNSIFDTGSGSPPNSARPIRAETAVTSGKVIIFFSSFLATFNEVFKLTEGARVVRILRTPSSNSGTNSVPKKE